MIKGLFLSKTPEMDKISSKELLNLFDPLNVYSTEDMEGSSYEMQEREYYTDKYKFQAFTLSTNEGFEALYDIYNSIQEAKPELLKVIKYSKDTLLVVIPIYEDQQLNTTYQVMLEELVRFSAFCVKTFVSGIATVSYIEDYINMCISWPNKK